MSMVRGLDIPVHVIQQTPYSIPLLCNVPPKVTSRKGSY